MSVVLSAFPVCFRRYEGPRESGRGTRGLTRPRNTAPFLGHAGLEALWGDDEPRGSSRQSIPVQEPAAVQLIAFSILAGSCLHMHGICRAPAPQGRCAAQKQWCRCFTRNARCFMVKLFNWAISPAERQRGIALIVLSPPKKKSKKRRKKISSWVEVPGHGWPHDRAKRVRTQKFRNRVRRTRWADRTVFISQSGHFCL